MIRVNALLYEQYVNDGRIFYNYRIIYDFKVINYVYKVIYRIIAHLSLSKNDYLDCNNTSNLYFIFRVT